MLNTLFIMELFLILSVLFVLGIIILKKSYDYEFLGVILSLIAGIYLIYHTLFWSLASYDYNKFVTKRKAFIETLEYARKI